MVKDHSDSEKGNPQPPHRLLLSINPSVLLYSTDRIAHTMAFVTQVVEHWLEREIPQWVHHIKDRSDEPPHHEQHFAPLFNRTRQCNIHNFDRNIFVK